tara:strand:- start:100 stop:477 length:378 start_codon:yes stop_codon:yes gene_type:complete
MINELITYIKDGLYFGFITCAYLETMFTIDLYLFDASLLANSVNDSNWSFEPAFNVLISFMNRRSQRIESSRRNPPAADDGARSRRGASVVIFCSIIVLLLLETQSGGFPEEESYVTSTTNNNAH